MTENPRHKNRFSSSFPRQEPGRRGGRPRRIAHYHRAILAAHLYDLGFTARDISGHFSWAIDEDGRCRTALAWIGEGRRILDDEGRILLKDPTAIEASRKTSIVSEMQLPFIVHASYITPRKVEMCLLHHAMETRHSSGKRRRGRPPRHRANTRPALQLVLGEKAATGGRVSRRSRGIGAEDLRKRRDSRKRRTYECHGIPAALALEILESRNGMEAGEFTGKVLGIPYEELLEMGTRELHLAALVILDYGFTVFTGRRTS
jgi:hypothetical protein